MPSLSNVQRTILSQHTLQGDDLSAICNLASVEGADIDSLWASIVSWDFDQLLGFTLHLFITAESSEVRTQVAQILPKFGSQIVRPLVKIAHHFDGHDCHGNSDISTLAQQSIQQINPQALSLGFEETLTGNNAEVLLPIVVTCLTSLTVPHYEAVLSDLAQHLPAQDYQALERQILNACSQSQLPTQLPTSFERLKVSAQSVNVQSVSAQSSEIASHNTSPAQKEAHLVG